MERDAAANFAIAVDLDFCFCFTSHTNEKKIDPSLHQLAYWSVNDPWREEHEWRWEDFPIE